MPADRDYRIPSGKEKCRFCKFFDSSDSEERTGSCRRYPPEEDKGFPSVYEDDWCGEFEPNIYNK